MSVKAGVRRRPGHKTENRRIRLEYAMRWWVKQNINYRPDYFIGRLGRDTQGGGDYYTLMWNNPDTGVPERICPTAIDPLVLVLEAWKHHTDRKPKPVYGVSGNPNITKAPIKGYRIGDKFIPVPQAGHQTTVKPKETNENNKTETKDS